MKYSKTILLTWFLFVSLLVFVPLPQANATLTQAEPFLTELTGLTFNPYCVDVDSQGWIFVKDHFDNSIWRSKDNGVSWVEVLDLTNHPSVDLVNTIFVDSRDYIHVSMWNSSTIGYFDIYRSIDGGDSWSKTLAYTYNLWHMTENSYGVLYVNCYATNHPLVYNSTDNGASWNLFQDLTGTDAHVHTVAVDIATDDVYIALGDATNVIKLWRNDTKTISTFISGSTYASVTDIWSDGTYVYLCPDGQNRLVRFPSRGSWSQRETVFDTTSLGASNNAFECVRHSDGLVFFGTEKGKLLGSWDNEHWVKLLDLGTSANSIYSISNRKPIYVTRRGITAGSGRLWRVNIQKEDLIRIFNRQFLTVDKSFETNSENFVLEQRLNNGTSYVDLTHVALTNVQATIKGLDRKNQYNNSGWETGAKTGWTETTAPLGTIGSDTPANGTYYYQRAHNYATGNWLWQGLVSSKVGDVHILSFYAKANVTTSNAVYIQYMFSPDGSQTNLVLISLTTDWQRFSFGFSHTSVSYTSFRWILQFQKTMYLETHLDSLIHSNLEVGHIIAGASETDGIQFVEGYYGQNPYFEGTQNTINPSLSVNGQTVSHSGTLTNGTESTPQSLSGILTGAVEVSANIQGSGQAILRLNGTRVFYEDSVIIKGYANSTFYGRYYGTLSFSINSTALGSTVIALTQLQYNITSIYFSGKLTLQITGTQYTLAAIKIHVANRGNATEVIGATSWNYNSPIITVTRNLTSTMMEVSVFWYPQSVYGTEVAIGGIIAVGTGSLLFWWWRRKTKTRTMSIPT